MPVIAQQRSRCTRAPIEALSSGRLHTTHGRGSDGLQVLARAVRPASAERVRPAANVSGNWTNVAMGPWLTKRSSVASYCPAANRSVSADIVAAALQARHICSRRHAGQTVPLRAQNGSSARRLDRASERADPMTFHSLRGRPSKPANQSRPRRELRPRKPRNPCVVPVVNSGLYERARVGSALTATRHTTPGSRRSVLRGT